MLAALLLPACAPVEVPEEIAELEAEIADLEDDVAAKDRELAGLEGDVGDLEDEIAALRKPAEVYQWDMTGSALYRGTESFAVVDKWCADLKEASGGRLDITLFGDGEIMPIYETLEATSQGLLKINYAYDGYFIGDIPVALYSVGAPPFTLRTIPEYLALYHQYGLEDLLREAFAEHNIYYVRPMPMSSFTIMSNFPVREAADLTGKLMRSSGINADVLAEAGASVVFFPWGEIYGALEKGIVDGILVGPLTSLYESGFHEVSKYWLETPTTPIDNYTIHVNLDTWKTLPDDIKALLYQSAAGHCQEYSGFFAYYDAVYRAKILEEGLTITSLPDEEIRIMAQYTMAVLDKRSAEDPYVAEATVMLKKYMKELGYLE